MTNRNYSSISQSAKWLALTRATTTIPFAREAAVLLFGEAIVREAEPLSPTWASNDSAISNSDTGASIRAWRLSGIGTSSRLGRDSRFGASRWRSRRGFTTSTPTLPELLAVKADLVARLDHPPLHGTLRLEPLDALAPGALAGAVRHMPAGPVAIVNEGLLMYLDASEKERLATSIRGILQEADREPMDHGRLLRP
jgi:hypothetical protein